ncbi:MAG: KOW domain-containing RNA-binding protein [Clostridia bacterium]
MDDHLRIGCVVYSKMGRDSGKYYMVVSLADQYAYIADGNLRKLKNPKKKNIKHIKDSGIVLETIAEKLISGKKVFDTELSSAIRELNSNNGGN